MEETITYPLVVKKKLWEKFKSKVPKTKTLNDVIVRLIEKDLEGKNV